MRFASSEFCDLFIYHESNTFYETTQILNSSSFDGNLPKKLNVVSCVHGVFGCSCVTLFYFLFNIHQCVAARPELVPGSYTYTFRSLCSNFVYHHRQGINLTRQSIKNQRMIKA